MSKFIIIEGTDNVGKDTQQDLIIAKVNDLVFHKIHYTSLPFSNTSPKNQYANYSKKMYNDMFKLMMNCKDDDINIIFNHYFMNN